MDSNSMKKRARRTGYQASSNGCLTCKNRRIKCDETRPVCRQCSRAKRACNGPVSPRVRFASPQTESSFSSTSISRTPSSQISVISGHNGEEQRLFDYFVHKAAPTFAGRHNVKFWADLIPRWSVTNSVLWSAILAISNLHEQIQTNHTATLCCRARRRSGYQRSLEYYGRAIQEKKQTKDIDIASAFMSCFLFTVFEFQLWNLNSAFALVKTVHGLSAQLAASQCPPNDLNMADGESNCRILVRLSTYMLPTTSLPTVICAPTEEPDMLKLSPFVTRPHRMDEYTKELYRITFEASKIVSEVNWWPFGLNRSIEPAPCSHADRQVHIMHHMEQWHTAILDLQALNLSCYHTYVIELMLMYYWQTFISLSTAFSRQNKDADSLETAFDEHVEAFEKVVGYGKAALAYAHAHDEANSGSLLFELNPSLPLLFVAIKCRHARIRREAEVLIRDFDALVKTGTPWVAAVASAVIRVEESGRELSSASMARYGESPSGVSEEGRIRRFRVSVIKRPGLNGPEQILVVDLVLHPCGNGLHGCIRHVVIRPDTGEILEDETGHAGECWRSSSVLREDNEPGPPEGLDRQLKVSRSNLLLGSVSLTTV